MNNRILTIAAISLIAFAACKKETKETNIVPDPTLAGEWYGLYGGSLTTIPGSSYYFNIRSNNTMKIASADTSMNYFADSTYTVTTPTDSLKCTYTYRNKTGSIRYQTYSIACKFLSNYSFMSGTWGYGTNAYNGGSFFMGRKQK